MKSSINQYQLISIESNIISEIIVTIINEFSILRHQNYSCWVSKFEEPLMLMWKKYDINIRYFYQQLHRIRQIYSQGITDKGLKPISILAHCL